MGRQLASFGDISYTYNESGLRTSKTIGNLTTRYYLNGTNIVEQTDGTTSVHFFYDSHDELIGFKYNSNNYYYIKNATDDIIGIVDSSGNLITTYEYDTWGKVLSVGGDTTIGNLNPFRYRSYYYDVETDLYYLQSRYYDPEVGRFLNTDDIRYIGIGRTANSYNAFAYCENNPVNKSDPSGYSSVISVYKRYYTLIAAIVSLMAVVSAISSTGVINPTGVLVGAGVLVVGVAGIAIYANIQTATKTETRTLADTTARTSNNHVFRLAYVDKSGNLITVGKALTFVEAPFTLISSDS